MLGVVLWSNVSDRKAVIWCEDQGDLAYLNGACSALRSDSFFDAGDLVQFDMEVQSCTRVANNPRLVIEKAGPALPEVLRRGIQEVEAAKETSRIVPFQPLTLETQSTG